MRPRSAPRRITPNLKKVRDTDIGYTHYWQPTTRIEPSDFARLSALAAEVASNIWATKEDLELAYEYDEPEKDPAFEEDLIRFNGVGSEGHETFLLTPSMTGFQFCKTAQKDYDVVVTAVLCLYAFLTGTAVTSDGTYEDWIEGLRYAQEVLPECTLPRALAIQAAQETESIFA